MTNEENSYAWVQLYRNEEELGQPFEVSPLPRNVWSLKKEVKDMCAPDLTEVAPNRLSVFLNADAFHDGNLLRVDVPVPMATSADLPLIVAYRAPDARLTVAPPATPTATASHKAVPPSEGKAPKLQKSLRHAPSTSEGKAEALDRVAPHGLWVSSQSIAIDLVTRLFEMKEIPAEKDHLVAAERLLLARDSLGREDVNALSNERFYTGTFCDCLNFLLGQEASVQHQGCIGERATHSDLSARCVTRGWSPTIFVGEGKKDSNISIRKDVQGQIMNELIRHRAVDRIMRNVDHRPILLLAFNADYASVDLAFPSSTNGNMQTQEWLGEPKFRINNAEIFWTIQIAFFCIRDGNQLLLLLRFLVEAIKYLKDLPEDGRSRVQFKTPWSGSEKVNVKEAKKKGDNVTIVTTNEGDSYVYKEYCYYLREPDEINHVEFQAHVAEAEQRLPPPKTLLTELGRPYSEWEILEYAKGRIKILRYPFIEGTHWPQSLASWQKVLKLVDLIHKQGYVHGDLLPRNLVFAGDDGFVIDFDLMREEGQPYVSGFNDDLPYRHSSARGGFAMTKEHDIHSLFNMGLDFFVPTVEGSPEMEVPGGMNDLIDMFSATERWTPNKAHQQGNNEASNSPERGEERFYFANNLFQNLNVG